MKTFKTSKKQYLTFVNSLVVFILSISFSFAQVDADETTDTGQTISVVVNKVKNNSGQIMFALHTNDTWMKSQGIQNINSSIKDNTVTVTFKNVKPGAYAIMVLHDENENNRMDFENGMPQENYGMSNNPLSYGPPNFSEAKFEVTNKNLNFDVRF
ncbi:DUF2141 domain-containing protein [Olleya sp.]|jgi:uncharacterized protein (DUF2141 family)|uniref:DUF2141 domain-containing protein n=1 Tax=Olleya sp. TaxID=1906788 RepID=UPI0032D8CFCF